jgi:hypothetical protein
MTPVRISTSYTAACSHLMLTAPTPGPALQVGAREVPRSKTLPERPPVRVVTTVLPPVARASAKPAGNGAQAARTSGDVTLPPREALQDLPAQPAGSPLPGDRRAGASCAAPVQPSQPPAGSQQASVVAEDPAQQRPAAGSGLCSPQQPDGPPLQLQQQLQQDVELADAVTAEEQSAEPAAMAATAAMAPPAMAAEATAAAFPPKTPARSRLSQATTARHAPDFAGAGNTAVVAGAAPSAVTHEYIHGVLEKVRCCRPFPLSRESTLVSGSRYRQPL